MLGQLIIPQSNVYLKVAGFGALDRAGDSAML
jgi:hypothetical protein